MDKSVFLNRRRPERRVLLFFALLAGILAGPFQGEASAADAKGNFAVRGVGSLTCPQLVSSLTAKDEQAKRESILLYISWIDGYLSHVNRGESATFDIVPFVQTQDMLAVVLTQCQTRQDVLVETVLLQTLGALAPARVHTDSPVVAVRVGKREGNLRKETILAIQKKLIERKLLKGSANGEFNDASRKALTAFQKSVKLDGTGFPDVDTIIRLLLS